MAREIDYLHERQSHAYHSRSAIRIIARLRRHVRATTTMTRHYYKLQRHVARGAGDAALRYSAMRELRADKIMLP